MFARVVLKDIGGWAMLSRVYLKDIGDWAVFARVDLKSNWAVFVCPS